MSWTLLILHLITFSFKSVNSGDTRYTDIGRPDCEDLSGHPNYEDLYVEDKECGFGFEEILQKSTSGRIFGGEQAILGEFPWIVQLRVEHVPDGFDRAIKGRSFYPAPDELVYSIVGTLISSRHIITSGHALFGNPRLRSSFYAKVTAVFGSWKLGKLDESPLGYKAENGTDCQGVDINVLKRRCAPLPFEVDCPYDLVRTHPEHDPVGHNNIALLRMAKHINFNDYVRPICLPWSCEVQNVNLIQRKLYSAGWGITESTGFARDILRKVELRGIANRDCRAAYADTVRTGPRGIFDSEQCAEGWTLGDGPCKGDGGGPLMMKWQGKWYVMGVRAFNHRCAGGTLRPFVFDYLPSFLSWLLESTFDH